MTPYDQIKASETMLTRGNDMEHKDDDFPPLIRLIPNGKPNEEVLISKLRRHKKLGITLAYCLVRMSGSHCSIGWENLETLSARFESSGHPLKIDSEFRTCIPLYELFDNAMKEEE